MQLEQLAHEIATSIYINQPNIRPSEFTTELVSFYASEHYAELGSENFKKLVKIIVDTNS